MVLTIAGAAAVLCLVPVALRAAAFTASLDRDTVAVGETATLTLTFSGGEPKSMPTPSAMPGLQIESGGVSRNFSIINGQQSFTLSQSFLLTPPRPGVYIIPPMKAELDGRILASQSLKLTAVKAEASAADNSGQQLAFLKLLLPKREIYLGEVIGMQLQLFIRDGVMNANDILTGFERLGGSPLKTEGFSVLKTACAQRRRVQLGNGIFDVATLVTSLSPVKTGPLEVASINATLALKLPEANRRRDFFSFFEQFQEKRVAVATEPETVTVLPLPPNAPADFNGAVGSYTLAVTASPTNVAAGDPITVKIQLSGSGALDALALPDQPAWRNFKIYPSSSKIESNDPLQIAGTKTFEEVVVPQNTDLNVLPPVSFSYFDSERRSYQTLTGPAIALTVRPGGSTAVPAAAAANRAGPDPLPPSQDIVPIKQRPGRFALVGPPLLRQPWFLALQTAPMLALLSAAAWRQRCESLARNPRLRRRRQVARLLREGLNDLRKWAAANNSDEFFATLFRLLQEQLGERLDLPASAITEAVIEEHLRPHGVAETTLGPLHELFQTCNLARYAPIKSSQELAAFIPKIETVLQELQAVTL
jgi:hypothetical protein